MILPASYSNGFAPRDGQPLYESLWRGCVGAWNPGLGPSGLTLRDWSRLNRHAALTSFDPTLAWAPQAGMYAVVFDGVNDKIDFTGLIQPLPFTVSFAIQPVSLASQDMRLFSYTSGGDLQFSTRTNGTSVETFTTGLSWATVVTGLTTLAVNYIAITATSSGAVGYLNGSQSGAAAATAGISSFRSFGGPFISGQTFGSHYSGSIWNVMLHNRVLNPNEIRLLASRRGIAYELAPRRRSSVQVVAGFKAAWISRRSLVIGGGTN